MRVIIRNFEANELKISTNAGTINKGIRDTSINAPIDIKNRAANISLRGIVITRAVAAFLYSDTNTQASNAPVAAYRPRPLSANDKPNASPRITIKSIA